MDNKTLTPAQPTPQAERLEKIKRVIADAANQANLLSVNTAIIAEKLESKEGINVIAKELQTLAEQLKLAAEEMADISL
jgi:methyl-accepting chemotaxis protein